MDRCISPTVREGSAIPCPQSEPSLTVGLLPPAPDTVDMRITFGPLRDVSERRWNSQSSANASNCSLGNFSMTRYGGGFPRLSVDVKAMLPSFAHELAAVSFQMPN